MRFLTLVSYPSLGFNASATSAFDPRHKQVPFLSPAKREAVFDKLKQLCTDVAILQGNDYGTIDAADPYRRRPPITRQQPAGVVEVKSSLLYPVGKLGRALPRHPRNLCSLGESFLCCGPCGQSPPYTSNSEACGHARVFE